jgi:hypothetical protein
MIQGVNKKQNTKTRAQKELSRISMNLQENLPNLNESQARGLSEIVSAILHTGSCSRTKIVYYLADRLSSEIEAVRKRVARWTRGITKEKKHEIDVSQSVTSLMAWIVSKWPSKQMALAIDMTHLSDKWIVMVVTVLYGQFGIPVNWRVFRASEKFCAREIWPSMLKVLSTVIPKDFEVLVLSDRGLWSPDLFREIQKLGWHPFMRVSGQGCFTPDNGSDSIHYLRDLAKNPGEHREMCGVAFASSQVRCTALAAWEDGHKAAWIVLTDLPPDHKLIHFYRLRSWCEHTFKLLKRGGFEWHKTRMTDPKRAERMWLAFSVAMFWSALAAVRSGRQMKPHPPTPPPSTEHWIPTEHNLRALVSLGVDIIRASTCPLLDLLAEQLSPSRWHIGSGTFQKTKSNVPL